MDLWERQDIQKSVSFKCRFITLTLTIFVGSGPTYLSGWITAFCFWDADGKCFHKPPNNPPSKEVEERNSFLYTGEDRVMVLDDVRYHIVDTSNIPPGFATVPIILDDNGHITHARMAAGELLSFI